MKRKNKSLILKNFCKLVTPTLGMTTVVALTALPSQANWYLDHYEASGTSNAPVVVWPEELINAGPIAWPNPGEVNNGKWNRSLYGAGGGISMSGDVTAVFKWNGSNPFPGGKVGIRFESEAMGKVALAETLQLNPGAKLLSVQPANEIDPDTGTMYTGRRLGKELFVKDVAQGATEVKQSITMSANSSDSGYLHLFASAHYDPRSVVITRGVGDREKTVYQGGIPVTYGHTIFSTPNAAPPSTTFTYSNQNFQANYTGNWSNIGPISHVQWNWVQNASDLNEYIDQPDTQTSAKRYSSLGNLYSQNNKWAGQGKPQTTGTMKYYARDNGDDAVAEAQYVLGIHEPVEISSDFYTSKTTPAQPYFGTNGLLVKETGVTPANQTVPAGTHSYTTGGATAKTTGWAVGISGGLNIDTALKLLGLDVTGITFGINGQYEQSITVETSQSSTLVLQTPLTEFQAAYIEIAQNYNDHHTEYRWYETSGEVRRPGSAELPATSDPWEWKWQKLGNPVFSWAIIDTRVENMPESGNPLIQIPSPQFSRNDRKKYVS